MAIDKDPSIYRDRGTIGSSDELDEYGVWVKSEPQVLRAESSGATQNIEPALPDIEDLPDLDLEISDDLPLPAADQEPVIAPSDELVPDFTDLPTFSMDEEAEEPSSLEKAESLPEEIDDQLSESAFTELSMDDFLDSSDTPLKEESTASLEAPVEEEELQDIDLDFSSADEPETAPVKEVAKGNSQEAVALETVSDFDDFLNELSDQSSPTPPPVSAETIDELPELNIDLDINEEEESTTAMNNEEISVDLSASESIPEIEEHFDDVGAVGKELEDDAGRRPEAKSDLSTELLMRIADELSSIKTELSSLKGELSVLRTAAKTESVPAAADHESAHGFFDEEDDEKIALTGDELDNILNTADFTEEAGADAGEEMEDSNGSVDVTMDFLSDKPDIVFDEEITEEIAPAPAANDAQKEVDDEPAFESIDIIDEAPATEVPLEIAELQENGVTPMTPAPEDTSYLEQGEVEIPSLGANETIDLSEAVIEEPDLGDFTLEEPHMEEPSIESIDIDLDLEEPLHVEEIVLPADAKEESFEEVLPEGFVVESEADGIASSQQEPVEEIEEELESDESEETVTAPAVQGKMDAAGPGESAKELPQNLQQEVRAVLSYMDQLLESLPESKIEEFARSEYFDTYKKLFEELGIA